MNSLSLSKELFNHMHWANAKIWESVLPIPEAQKDEKLKILLHHLHVVQYAFYNIWSNLPLQFPEVSKFNNLQELCSWASKNPKLLQSIYNKPKRRRVRQGDKCPLVKQA